MKQINSLIALSRQILLVETCRWFVFQFTDLKLPSEGLLIFWDHLLLWFHNSSQFNEASELWWNFSLVDAFYLAVHHVLLLGLGKSSPEMLFGHLTLVQVV